MVSIEELVREEVSYDHPNLIDHVSDGEGDDFQDLEAPILFDDSFPTTVLLCNLPKVPREKEKRLNECVGKIIDKTIGPNERFMPFKEVDGKDMSEGFMIVTCESEEKAEKAVIALTDVALDKKHTFKVIKLTDYEEVMRRTEHFSPKRTLNSFSRHDFRRWLEDKKCWEQLLVRYQNQTEIHWFDSLNNAPLLCYGGEREKAEGKVWCDWKVQWSPRGSYITTFHKQGIALWAGPSLEKKQKFPHSQVRYAHFSPTEEYLLTWDGTPATEQKEDAVKIFRVLTGELVKKHKTPLQTPSPDADFPNFAWSHDGKYYAECTETSLTIRSTDNFEIIKDGEGKKKRWSFENLQSFQWSPNSNVIAVWTLETDQGNHPCRLSLLEVPSRKEVSVASRTQVEATVHWQSEGDYLCLMSTKLSKKKKGATSVELAKKKETNLEIFRMRERNVPVDIVEVKDTVKGFFWESKGSRFAVLTTDEAGAKPRLSLYQLGKEKCEQVTSFDLPSNSFNKVYWAPEGNYFVVVGLQQGDLLFCGLTQENKLEVLFKDEHYMVTHVEWSPCSRYLLTSVQQPMANGDVGHSFKYSMEAGYQVWTFQGRRLYQQQKEKLYNVCWRPHPPSLISKSNQEMIRKNIKSYSKKYDAIDEQARESARNAYRKERDEKTNMFNDILDRLIDWKYDYEEWIDAEQSFARECAWEMTENITEEPIEVSEELIS